MSSGKWRLFWLRLSVLNWPLPIHNKIQPSINQTLCIILRVYLYMPFGQDVFTSMKSEQFSIQQQINAKYIQ